jgi:hypothetical protein
LSSEGILKRLKIESSWTKVLFLECHGQKILETDARAYGIFAVGYVVRV